MRKIARRFLTVIIHCSLLIIHFSVRGTLTELYTDFTINTVKQIGGIVMYCNFCGAELENGSKFCRLCGKPQINESNDSKIIEKNGIPSARLYLIGAVFILAGLLPYLFAGDTASYNNYLQTVYSNYNAFVVSTFISFSSSYFARFFYLSSSLISVYTGFLILKKKDVPKASVIVSIITHTVSVLYIAVSNFMIYCLPKTVSSLYTNESYLINQGEMLMRSEPDLLSLSRNASVLRAVTSLMVIALSAVLLVMKKRFPKNENEKSVKISSAGGIAMIFSIALIYFAHSILGNLTAYVFGDYAMASKMSADNAFSACFGLPSLLILVVIIGIAVIFTRAKRWIIALPVTAVIALFAAAGYVLSYQILVEFYIPTVLFEMTIHSIRGLVVSCALILVSVFFWFGAVSKNRIPTWLQIVVPLIFSIIYFISEFAAVMVLNMNTGISLGAIVFSAAVTAVSVFVRSSKKSAD